ncbi:MAG: zinc-dependent alcohol dehydrogenase family protein [Cyclobacteriaceae bacterium]|nr:zinc-dependent alcohol dehydrogenase family protein [Cyclobacteriaceae bacterium]
MKAWVLKRSYNLNTESHPLELTDLPIPVPEDHEILIRVSCCGVCHTELDEIEGRTLPIFPIVPGHQVIGNIEKRGKNATKHKTGDRVGVAWIFSSCGQCEFCESGQENLCESFKGTGRDENGGYAEFMVVHEKFAYHIPDAFSDAEAAPLLCAGAIGYRSLQLSGMKNGHTLGLTGFGASGHLVLKMVAHLYPESKILVFARSKEEQVFARSLGAYWAGDVTDTPPFKANAIIDTTPVWKTTVESLLHLKPAGRLVINAIRKESVDQKALLDICYQDHLWMEKEIKSVANITREDVEEFLQLAADIPIKPEVEIYSFDQANDALLDLKQKHVRGAKVLVW